MPRSHALPILERTLGLEHPDLSHPLVGLARVAIHRGRGDEAVALLAECEAFAK